ncbi:flotillin-like FloA family protein, partial [bacterium]|nr:flotillin-like FloA family protein [bacterium]
MDPKAIMAFVLVIAIIISIVILIFILKFLKIYVQAWASKADITMASLIGMWLRKVNTGTIVNTKIAAIKAGIMISTEELESLYLAGGDVMNVVRALIAADKANIELNFKQAAGIDLAG